MAQNRWTADIANDPDHDYDLVIELREDGKDVAVIRRGQDGLELVWYADRADRTVPVKWLKELLAYAEERLLPPLDRE